jgi:hypothetical protein
MLAKLGGSTFIDSTICCVLSGGENDGPSDGRSRMLPSFEHHFSQGRILPAVSNGLIELKPVHPDEQMPSEYSPLLLSTQSALYY